MSKYKDARDLAWKVEHEAGPIEFVGGYGVKAEDLPDDLPDEVRDAFLTLIAVCPGAFIAADLIDEWIIDLEEEETW